MATTGFSSQDNVMTEGKGPLPTSHQDIVKEVRVKLINGLEPRKIQNELYSKGLINHDELQNLKSLPRREGVEYILECLHSSGSTGLNKFIQVIQEKGYKDLADDLERTRTKKFPTEIKVVLYGKTGVGKSRLGNLLLRRQSFISKRTPESVTGTCSLNSTKMSLCQKEVTVNIIDTPGLADTNRPTCDIINEIVKCMKLAGGKVHVFIVILSLTDRMTDENKEPVKMFRDRFGSNAEQFVLVVFTHKDQLEDTTLEDFIEASPYLQDAVQTFRHNFCAIGKDSADDDVGEIFKRIKTMIENNNYTHYSSQLYQLAEKQFNERSEDERKRIEKEKRREIEELLREERLKMEEERNKMDEKTRKMEEERNTMMENFDKRLEDETKRIEKEKKRELEKLRSEIQDAMRREEKEKIRSEIREEMRREKKDDVRTELQDVRKGYKTEVGETQKQEDIIISVPNKEEMPEFELNPPTNKLYQGQVKPEYIKYFSENNMKIIDNIENDIWRSDEPTQQLDNIGSLISRLSLSENHPSSSSTSSDHRKISHQFIKTLKTIIDDSTQQNQDPKTTVDSIKQELDQWNNLTRVNTRPESKIRSDDNIAQNQDESLKPSTSKTTIQPYTRSKPPKSGVFTRLWNFLQRPKSPTQQLETSSSLQQSIPVRHDLASYSSTSEEIDVRARELNLDDKKDKERSKQSSGSRIDTSHLNTEGGDSNYLDIGGGEVSYMEGGDSSHVNRLSKFPTYPQCPRVNFEGVSGGNKVRKLLKRVKEWDGKEEDWMDNDYSEWCDKMNNWFNNRRYNNKIELKLEVEDLVMYIESVMIESGIGSVDYFENLYELISKLLQLNLSDDVIKRVTYVARKELDWSMLLSDCSNRDDLQKEMVRIKGRVDRFRTKDRNTLSTLQTNLDNVLNQIKYKQVKIGKIGIIYANSINCDIILHNVLEKWNLFNQKT